MINFVREIICFGDGFVGFNRVLDILTILFCSKLQWVVHGLPGKTRFCESMIFQELQRC